jgi:hypothetical protein
MPGHPVPKRTDITGQQTPVVGPRAAGALGLLAAALLALSLASAPAPARAVSVLSDGSVTPASGTTATIFTFSVSYTSTDSPTRPAQAVWAQVGGVTVTLSKVSGSAHDGTWQGSATLPAGTWQGTFHASTSADPQPEPLAGPMITVTEPPPTPAPLPTAAPTPRPPAPPPPTPVPVPQPTAAPLDDDDPSGTQRSSASPASSASGSASPGPSVPTLSPSADGDDDPSESPGPVDPAADEADTPPGSRFASLLMIGGSMSLIGAAVLGRQWFVAHRARSH